MTITISTGADLIFVPSLILPESFTRDSRTIRHMLLSGRPAYTYRPAQPTTGIIIMLFTSAVDARAAVIAHASPGPLTLADSTDASAGFDYVVTGPITCTLDEVTRRVWSLSATITKVA